MHTLANSADGGIQSIFVELGATVMDKSEVRNTHRHLNIHKKLICMSFKGSFPQYGNYIDKCARTHK